MKRRIVLLITITLFGWQALVQAAESLQQPRPGGDVVFAVGDVAERRSFSRDGLPATFTLFKNIKFHDGIPLKFSYPNGT